MSASGSVGSRLGVGFTAATVLAGLAYTKSRTSSMTQVRRNAHQAPLVVIAGPPAAGKGTQCEKITERFGLCHLSTGDVLRENVKAGTELGLKAKTFMDAGMLVPSDLIIGLVKEKLTTEEITSKGCLLDGFPRAPDQAKAMLDAGIKIDKFLLIKVPDDILVERGCGRRLDPETGNIYHLKFKPPPAEIVGRLVHRSDDQEDKIRTRLQTYHSQIDGILPFFSDVLHELDGDASPDAVFDLVVRALDC